MHAFTDAYKRRWELEVNVAVVKKVRGLLNLDLYALIEDGAKPLGDLLGDPCRLVDLLYVLCREQADKAGVSDEDFGRGFAGDSLEEASEAFVRELCDFFPSRRGREALLKVLEKSKAAVGLLHDEDEKKLQDLSVESLAGMLRKRYGVLPEGSASTPPPSPSANS